MSEEDNLIEIRRTSNRGHSIGVTLPPKIVEYLGIKSGDYLAMYYDKKTGAVSLKPVEVKTTYTTRDGKEFPTKHYIPQERD